MDIQFETPCEQDAEALRQVHNKAFYADFIKYGLCPGYGRTVESIRDAMNSSITYKIIADNVIVGKISAKTVNDSCEYHLECLCVIPEYENKGIGKLAVEHLERQHPDATKWSLETPADNKRNIRFYERCGYSVTGSINDGIALAVLSKTTGATE